MDTSSASDNVQFIHGKFSQVTRLSFGLVLIGSFYTALQPELFECVIKDTHLSWKKSIDRVGRSIDSIINAALDYAD